MDNLKQFIDENRGDFEMESLPSGHKMRFERRISSAGRLRRRIYYITGAAAAIILAVMVPLTSVTNGDEQLDPITAMVFEYERTIGLKATELYEKAVQLDDHNQEIIINTIDQLLYEAIPFVEQIPAGLSNEEKEKIFRDYYTTKLNSFDTVSACIGELMEI